MLKHEAIDDQIAIESLEDALDAQDLEQARISAQRFLTWEEVEADLRANRDL